VLAARPAKTSSQAPRRHLYDDAFRQALIVLWEAGDRVCGKRLKVLIPLLIEAMERHGHLQLDPSMKTLLLRVSAATIDRLLSAARASANGQRRRRAGVGSAIRRSIPVRTSSDWRNPQPGFLEVDMVEHCGPKDGGRLRAHACADGYCQWLDRVCCHAAAQPVTVVEVLNVVDGRLPFKRGRHRQRIHEPDRLRPLQGPWTGME